MAAHAPLSRSCSNCHAVTTLDDYEIRAATREHHESLCELSRFLDTVNLPDDPEALHDVLLDVRALVPRRDRRPAPARVRVRAVGSRARTARSARRWSSASSAAAARRTSTSTSATRRSTARRSTGTSSTRVLATRYSYDGPTEIGGLVVHPGLPPAARAARHVHLLRALPVHRDAPRRHARRDPGRAPAAARSRRHEPPLGSRSAAASPA